MAHPKLTHAPTLRALAALTAAGCLASCGNLINLNEKARQKRRMMELERLASASTTEARSRLGDKAAGEIVYADPTAGFVLIRPLTGLTIPTGTKLESRREARTTGELIITPERKGSFAAADVTSGSPQAGDSIIPTGSAPPPEPTPITTAGNPTTPTPTLRIHRHQPTRPRPLHHRPRRPPRYHRQYHQSHPPGSITGQPGTTSLRRPVVRRTLAVLFFCQTHPPVLTANGAPHTSLGQRPRSRGLVS
jgi:hypothetical protein